MPTVYDVVMRVDTTDENQNVLSTNWDPVSTNLATEDAALQAKDDLVPPDRAWRILRRDDDGGVVTLYEEQPPSPTNERRRGSPRRPPGPGGS